MTFNVKGGYSREAGQLARSPTVLKKDEIATIEVGYDPGTYRCVFKLYVHNGRVLCTMRSKNKGTELVYYRDLSRGSDRSNPGHTRTICTPPAGTLNYILTRDWGDRGVIVEFRGLDEESVIDCSFQIDIGPVPSAIDQLASRARGRT